MRELLQRWNAPMPTFWLRMRAFFIVLAFVGMAFITFPSYVPAFLIEPSKYLVAIGIAVSVVSSFAKKDASDIVKIDIPKALGAQVQVSLATPTNDTETTVTVEHTDQQATSTTDGEDAEA